LTDDAELRRYRSSQAKTMRQISIPLEDENPSRE
jgi:hypothetical protein